MRCNSKLKPFAAILVSGVFLLLTVCGLPILTDSYEPNNSFSQAAAISPGTIKATIEPDNDEDYYKLSLSSADSFQLNYGLEVPSIITAEVSLFSSSQSLMDYVRADTAGQSLAGHINISSGDYYVRIRSVDFSSSDSDYTLSISVLPLGS